VESTGCQLSSTIPSLDSIYPRCPQCVLDHYNLDIDGDGLVNSVETNTGIFISVFQTGTNPNNPDTDVDGLRDGDEIYPTATGLNLRLMGVSPVHKNLLLEHDWFADSLDCGAHSHEPSTIALNRMTASFASLAIPNPDGVSGITVIHDKGQGGVFTGGNLIADLNGVVVGGVDDAEFKAHKIANFDPARNGYFHYIIHMHNYDTNSGSSGQAELPGDDLIVSLQCFLSTVNVANTIVHELGHNLGLRHGGSEDCNYKPNYNSVMNYRYQFPGVDVNCDAVGDNILSYSQGLRIDLDENNLVENNGVCGPGNPIDWNLNSVIDVGTVSVDVNAPDDFCSGLITLLKDSNDLLTLDLVTGLGDIDKRDYEIMTCESKAADYQ